ncbi:bcl-2-like protein 2 [Halichondria panicea]|uniref:bcl-2-like protein 2 n=1 Tax=Halichondria panicea TaxID=6063 RepID=UPI00312B46E4
MAAIGDQIDYQYQDAIRKLAKKSGLPEQAFNIFNNVVKSMFSDQQGGVKITFGRIIAILRYCYELCKHLALQNVPSARLASFVSTVATWLFKSFIEARLYDWLGNVGGWSKLVAISGKNMFLFIGLGFLAIWALAYFRGK